jgi:hypothetical protein
MDTILFLRKRYIHISVENIAENECKDKVCYLNAKETGDGKTIPVKYVVTGLTSAH